MMHFSNQKGPAVLVMCDRRSRYTRLLKRDGKKSQDVMQGLQEIFSSLPKYGRKTLTVDNGQEFRLHDELRQSENVETFFCDTHSPWQKGTVENTIGRLRRRLPTRTDPHTFSQSDLDIIMNRLNNTPRKCLGFQTPAEVFFNQTVALQT